MWDFKKTLAMWHIKNKEAKYEKELHFCETIASFANAKGGVVIVKVSDTLPREISSIGRDTVEIERRLKYLSTVMSNYVQYDRDILKLKQVSVQDSSGNECICLIILIAQTADIVSVKDKQEKYSYPVRRIGGFDRVDVKELAKTKLHLKSDSFDFIQELEQYVRT